MTVKKRPDHRIKIRSCYRPFNLYKCHLISCCNFFTRDTINGDPKYCGSHLDKWGNMQKELKQYRPE